MKRADAAPHRGSAQPTSRGYSPGRQFGAQCTLKRWSAPYSPNYSNPCFACFPLPRRRS